MRRWKTVYVETKGRCPKPHFVVGNRLEACRHRHLSFKAAKRCFERVNRGLTDGVYWIYRVEYTLQIAKTRTV